MRRQYPPTPQARRALAAYVVHDLKINPMTELIPSLIGKHRIAESNGMLAIGAIRFPETLAETSNTPQELDESAFVNLVAHCIALVAPISVMARFAHSEHLARPQSALCAALWNHLAYLHSAPQAVCAAMQCLRPDMQQAVRTMYGHWLQRCRSPRHISAALEYLVSTPWHTSSGTTACHKLIELMRAAQVAAQQLKSTARADIVVDKRAGIIISKRDKCFLALTLVCGQWQRDAAEGIQEFASVRSEVPEAFQQMEKGQHPLDEIE